MFLSQMTSCHSSDTRTCAHTNEKEWSQCLAKQDIAGTWDVRLLAPLIQALIAASHFFHPFHFPLTFHFPCQWGHRLMQESHNAVFVCNMLILVAKESDFTQKFKKKVCDLAENNNFPPVKQTPPSGIFQLPHVVAFWLMAPKLVFMKHPTLPCLFALCCVLTINLAPGTATYNGWNSSRLVTLCIWKWACVQNAWGYVCLFAFE